MHIGHNVVVGNDCLLCGQVGIAGSSRLGKNVVLAGQTGVNDNIFIGDNVIAGGASKIFTTNPSDSNYLYLSVGTDSSPTAGTYTAGKFLIELYGTPLSDVPSITSITPSTDADFGTGFKMMTGGASGSYIDLCSQEAIYKCVVGRKWWIETQFKLDDHDATEFFFGIAEPTCGSEDLIFVSSTTFAKAAGKDRVGLSKLTHNEDPITASSTKNGNGSESISLTNDLNYDNDNNILLDDLNL